MYWKTLPREEREIWEAKALVAQAEHRKRYPDWRFRPGANALAKLKVKDGGGGSSSGAGLGNHNRRRTTQSRKSSNKDDPASGGGSSKGRIKEERCAKIADLLVEGKKGLDLAAAVKEWEGDADGRKSGEKKHKAPTVDGGEECEQHGKQGGVLLTDVQVDMGSASPVPIQDSPSPIPSNTTTVPPFPTASARCTRCRTPDPGAPDIRFKIPLTAMFKRSLSAPAGYSRCPCPDLGPGAETGTAIPADGYDSGYASPGQSSSVGSGGEISENMECLPPLLLDQMFGDGSRPWHDVRSPFQSLLPHILLYTYRSTLLFLIDEECSTDIYVTRSRSKPSITP